MTDPTELTLNLVEWHRAKLAAENDIETAHQMYHAAGDAAIDLLVASGYDSQDSDQWGQEIGDLVQSLLTVVILRAPDLAEHLLGMDNIWNKEL